VKRFRALAIAVLLAPAVARAEVSEASGRPDEQFDFMNLFAKKGLHDLINERWNVYGQSTFISSWKAPFFAKYTNLNGSNSSLVPGFEWSFTYTLTLFAGVKLWPGGEAYFVPEVVAEQALSGLKGLGGAIQNFELQKSGSTTPTIYRSRLYLQQRFDLGGKKVEKTSDPMQLANKTTSRRLVLRAGNFSVIDFFDKNTYAGDLRQTFFNMAFLTYAAYDFVADARGYSWGAMAELYWDDLAIRVGRLAPPLVPNSLALTFDYLSYYGDQAELEYNWKIGKERPGAVRLLGYRNVENMGRFDEATAAFARDPSKNAAACGANYNYGSTNATAPDLCWARHSNEKVGIGINLEQTIAKDVGLFFRGMISDGRTEVYSFGSTDRSFSFGATAKGALWKRPNDIAGIGFGMGFISDEHAAYLRRGGVDGFIGDGTIDVAPESVVEAFYSLNVLSSLWLSIDYQHITNPAFNADRGPVDIFGARAHAEF
jgi:high affinity Mn2+ porin